MREVPSLPHALATGGITKPPSSLVTGGDASALHPSLKDGGAHSPLALRILIGLFCAACLAVTFARLFYGVDFGDECAYIAMPWRFILGDRPFIDEINPIQAATFITLPFFRLYVWATGGLEGVVLYARILYYAFTCLVAATAFASLRASLGTSLALVVAIACVVFVPLGMPVPCYNTLASGFFALGVFLGMMTILAGAGRGRDRFFFLAGVAHGFASVAIPTYVIASVIFASISAFGLSGERKLRRFLLYALGGVLAAALFLPYFLDIGRDTLSFTYSYTGGAGAWGSKLRIELWQLGMIVPRRAWIGAAVIAFIIAARRKSAWLAVLLSITFPLLVLFPIDEAPFRRAASSNSVCHVTLLALFAPVLFLFLRRSLLARSLFFGVWIPSSIAGIIAGWTSNNGIVNAGLGFLPASLVTCALAGLFANEARYWSRSSLVRHFALAVPIVSACMLCRYQRAVFLDDDVSMLDARMENGPHRGLYTTAAKKAWITNISDAVAAHASPHGRIFFTLHFPLGYLLTRMPPAANSVWAVNCRPLHEENCAEAVQSGLERFGKDGLVIVEVRRLLYSSKDTTTQPVGTVHEFIHGRYRAVLDQPDFTIFVAP